MKVLFASLRRSKLAVFALAATALLLLPSFGRAQVEDNAKLFSDAAKAEATKSIDQMRQKFKHTMLIATFEEPPADWKAAIEKDKDAGFKQWTDSIGKEEKINGIVLLICKNPAHFYMAIGNQTEKSGLFTRADRETMVPKIRDAMTASKTDDVATIAAASVLDRMVKNDERLRQRSGAGGAATPSAGSQQPGRTADCGAGQSMSSWFCIIIAVIGIALIVRGIFNGIRSHGGGYGGRGFGGGPNYGGPGYGQGGYGGPGYGGGGGGGGFGRGFLGGMLGGVAGGWLGNKVFGQNQSDYPHQSGGGGGGGSDYGSSGSSAPDYSAPDTDFSGGGSDYGSSGGGDSGGGFDSGGGGDFGGGGGGGGGDSGGSDF